MTISVPDDVTEHVRQLFADCNDEVSTEFATFPAMREESLDTLLISKFSRSQAPVRLPSNWIVRIDAHFIGGGRHYGSWEVADIAVLMIFRRAGKIVRSKIALLQSKKLYADPTIATTEDNIERHFGLGRIIQLQELHDEIIESRTLSFTKASKYGAFKKDDSQQETMGHFERRWGTQMYYLFYNPFVVPHSVKMPLEGPITIGENTVGSRVVPKSVLDKVLSKKNVGYIPTHGDIADGITPDSHDGMTASGWRLEEFAADLMLQCKEGLIDNSPNFESVAILANQKRRPISAAISISFEMSNS